MSLASIGAIRQGPGPTVPDAMWRTAIAGAILVVGCECYVVPRASMISMGAKKKTVSRRDVLDGNSLTKAFYDPEGFRKGLPPGWSPVLVLSLGAVAANYGSSVRTKLFDELQSLGGGEKNQGKTSHIPIVTLAPGRSLGQVAVTITAAATAPDAIDYIWAADADTGEIFVARKFTPKEKPSLVVNVARGRRLVPSVHSKADGVWEGEAIVAEA